MNEMNMKIKNIIPFVTTVIIMGLIFFFSAQDAGQSTEVSRGVTEKVVDVKYKEATQEEKKELVTELNGKMRKVAHFSLYAILGISVSAMFCVIFPNKKHGLRILWAIGACGLYACTDEIHQFFSDGRAPMLLDVGIDTLGAACGSGLYIVIRSIIFKITKRGGYRND